MSASLVGSEMCIRDRSHLPGARRRSLQASCSVATLRCTGRFTKSRQTARGLTGGSSAPRTPPT
eukprot:5236380-Alexandrium_andersonii.AAC.1